MGTVKGSSSYIFHWVNKSKEKLDYKWGKFCKEFTDTFLTVNERFSYDL